MSNKKGITTKRVQFIKGKIILSKSQFNGISTYTESNYYSVKPIIAFIITLLFIIAIITSHLAII